MTRILIVEDTLVGRRMLRMELAEAGFGDAELVEVADGAIALRRLVAEPFDLVLTDVYLPGLSGRRLVEQAREAGLSMPIVAVTADRSPELTADLVAAGATAVLVKPCSAADLRCALRPLAL